MSLKKKKKGLGQPEILVVKVSFNDKKCKVQQITRKTMQLITSYKLSSDFDHRERDLESGCRLYSLGTKKLIISLRKENVAELHHKTALYIKSTAVRRNLYLALVRPHLGYATQIWSPQ